MFQRCVETTNQSPFGARPILQGFSTRCLSVSGSVSPGSPRTKSPQPPLAEILFSAKHWGNISCISRPQISVEPPVSVRRCITQHYKTILQTFFWVQKTSKKPWKGLTQHKTTSVFFWDDPLIPCKKFLTKNHGQTIAFGLPVVIFVFWMIFGIGLITARILQENNGYVVKVLYYSKNFPTEIWSIPQTPNQQFMFRNSFHLGVWGCLGYAPGVCWGLCFETTQGGFDFDIFFLDPACSCFCGIPALGVKKIQRINLNHMSPLSIPTTLRGWCFCQKKKEKPTWATKKTLLLSMKYWLFNRDPYYGLL